MLLHFAGSFTLKLKGTYALARKLHKTRSPRKFDCNARSSSKSQRPLPPELIAGKWGSVKALLEGMMMDKSRHFCFSRPLPLLYFILFLLRYDSGIIISTLSECTKHLVDSQTCATITTASFENIYIRPKGSRVSFCGLFPFLTTPSSWQTPVCFLSLLTWAFWIFQINGITRCVAFGIWLVSFR